MKSDCDEHNNLRFTKEHERREKMFLGVFILIYIVLFLPAFLTDRIPNFMDIVAVFYPVKALAADLWRHLQLPLWNPFYYAGVPLLANPQWGVLYPGNILFFLHPCGWSFSLTLVLHSILAAVGIWILCKRFVTSSFSILAPVVFLFGGYVWAHYAFGSYLLALVWMAPILYCQEKYLFSESRIRWLLLAGLFFAFQFLAGAPQVTFYFIIAFTVLTIGIPLFYTPKEAATSRRLWSRSFGFFILSLTIGFLISLPQIVALYETREEIGRHAHLPLEDVLVGSLTLKQLVASFLGGTGFEFEDAETTAYFGIPAFFLLIVGLVGMLARPRKERLFTYAIVSLLLASIASRLCAPLFYKIMPLYAKFHDPKRALGVMMIFLPFFVARGAEILFIEYHGSKKQRTILIILSVLVLFFCLCINGRQNVFPPVDNFTQLGWLRLSTLLKPIIISIACGIFLLLFLILGIKRKLGLSYVAILLALILMVDLLYFSLSRVDIKMKPAKEIFDPHAIDENLFTAKSRYRFFTYDVSGNYSYDYFREDFGEILLPDAGTFFGLQDFQGYDPWKPRRYERYLESVNRGFIVPFKRHFGLIRNLWWSPLLSRASVKYIVGDAGSYHLFTLPGALLSYGETRIFQVEHAFETNRLGLDFIARAPTSSMEAVLGISILDNQRETLFQAHIGCPEDACEVFKGEVKSRKFSTNIVKGGDKHILCSREIELVEPIAPAQALITNLSPDARCLIQDISFEPVKTLNIFNLVGGDENQPNGVWEMEEPLPVVGFARKGVFASGESQAFQLLERLAHPEDKDTVILEKGSPFGGSSPSEEFATDATIEGLKVTPGRVEAYISTGAKPALLVIRQAYFKHWKAMIKDVKLQVYPCDGMFCGVILPAHTTGAFVCSFSPPYIKILFFLSIALSLLLIILLVLPLRKGKKSKER